MDGRTFDVQSCIVLLFYSDLFNDAVHCYDYIASMVTNMYRALVIYTDRKNERSHNKSVPRTLCLPQDPHVLIWNRTRVSVVKGQRLTESWYDLVALV